MARDLKNTNGNTYVNDPESGAEMARLLDQDRTLTACMGGLFPGLDDSSLERIVDVLDIACGPGGWAQEIAFAYPQMEVTGIDISKAMIEHARQQARIQHLENAHFQVMDVTAPLNFPDASFDLVNARLLGGFMLTRHWESLVRECWRILRPGGILRLTETDTWGITNSLAAQQLLDLANRASAFTGHSFDPGGHTLGITPMLERLLVKSGFQDIQTKSYAINFSNGAAAYKSIYANFRSFLKLMQPFLLRVRSALPEAGIPDQEGLNHLYEQMLVEMLEDNFVGIFYLLSVWGMKPETEAAG